MAIPEDTNTIIGWLQAVRKAISNQRPAVASSTLPNYVDGQQVYLSTDLNGQLRVTGISGGGGGGGGSTVQYAEDTPAESGDLLSMAGAVRQDNPVSLAGNNFDRTNISTDANGRLWVNNSGVTQPVSAASLPLPTGAATEATLATHLREGAPVTGQSLEAGGSQALGWLSSLRKAVTDLAAKLPSSLVGGRLDVNIGAAGVNVPVTGTIQVLGAKATSSAPAFTEGEIGYLSMDLTGTLRSTAGAGGGGGGSTQYAEDTQSADGELLSMAGVVRKDAVGSLVNSDGDRTELQVDGSGKLRVTTDAVTQPVSATTLPLPTGAATETTLGTRLAEGAAITGQSLEAGGSSALGWLASIRKAITDRLPANLIGGRLDVNVGATGVTQPISAASLPLPTNAAQDHTTAASPSSTRLSDGSAFYKPTTPSDTQPVSAASLPLPSGAAQEHATAASPHAARLSDGTAFYKATTPSDTQPVSGTVTSNVGTGTRNVNPTGETGGVGVGAIADAEVSSGNGSVIAILKRLRTLLAGGLPSALVGGRLDVNIGATGVTQPVSGTVTANAGTGTFGVNPTGETASVGVGAAADAEATANGSAIAVLKRLRTLIAGGLPASLGQKAKTASLAVTLASDQELLTAKATAAAPTYSEGASVPLSVDLSGTLRTTAGSGGSGGTQYAEDTASAAAEQLMMAGVVRSDAAASKVDTDGDRTELIVDGSGRLWVNGSGVTQPVSGTVSVSNFPASQNVDGDTAHDAVDAGDPVKIGGKAGGDWTLPTKVAAADRVNAWFTTRGALYVAEHYETSYHAGYRLVSTTAGQTSLTFTFATNTKKQLATMYHPVGATKTVRIKKISILPAVGAAGVFDFEVVRLSATTAPATGNPAITPAPYVSGNTAEVTCLALPTTAGSEAAVEQPLTKTVEWNSAAATAETNPGGLAGRETVLYEYHSGRDIEPITLKAATAEGIAVIGRSTTAVALRFTVSIEFTED